MKSGREVLRETRKRVAELYPLLMRLSVDVASLGLGYGVINILFDNMSIYRSTLFYFPMTFDDMFRSTLLLAAFIITAYGVGKFMLYTFYYLMELIMYVLLWPIFKLDDILLGENPTTLRKVLVWCIEMGPFLIILVYLLLTALGAK